MVQLKIFSNNPQLFEERWWWELLGAALKEFKQLFRWLLWFLCGKQPGASAQLQRPVPGFFSVLDCVFFPITLMKLTLPMERRQGGRQVYCFKMMPTYCKEDKFCEIQQLFVSLSVIGLSLSKVNFYLTSEIEQLFDAVMLSCKFMQSIKRAE